MSVLTIPWRLPATDFTRWREASPNHPVTSLRSPALDETAVVRQSNAVPDADHADIRASLQGDGPAYARLIRRHQDRIARHLWRFTRDRQALEELVQETFVQAWLSLRHFRGDAPFGHWLMRIATRVGYRFWKLRRRQMARMPAPQWNALPAAPLEPAQAGEALTELLAPLPPRDRLVLMLMYADGRSVAETAELTGWSQAMVKVQAFRARRKLRKILEQSGGPDRSHDDE